MSHHFQQDWDRPNSGMDSGLKEKLVSGRLSAQEACRQNLQERRSQRCPWWAVEDRAHCLVVKRHVLFVSHVFHTQKNEVSTDLIPGSVFCAFWGNYSIPSLSPAEITGHTHMHMHMDTYTSAFLI